MVRWIRHVAEPVIRLTTMHKVDHQSVFEDFAKTVERTALEERVRNEPRVVSFRLRRKRL